MNVLAPDHPYFNVPNRIGKADFDGWVQERGLYFLGARDPHYVELLSSADPFPKNPERRRASWWTRRWGRGRGPTSASACGGSFRGHARGLPDPREHPQPPARVMSARPALAGPL